MKNLLHAFTPFMAAAMLASAVACSGDDPVKPNDNGQDVPAGPTSGTVILDYKENSQASMTLSISEDWVVSSNIRWCYVTPISGKAGDMEFTFTAASTNTDAAERVGRFNVNDRTFYIVQRGIPTFLMKTRGEMVAHDASELSLPASGSCPYDQIEVTSDVSWLKFKEIRTTSEPELLEDGVTLSNVRESDIVLSVTDVNNGSESRTATVTINAAGQTSIVQVAQLTSQDMGVDFTRAFYRRSIMLKGTGTWCGNCPLMSAAMEQAQKDMPGRMIGLYCYDKGDGKAYPDGGMHWDENDKIYEHFYIHSFPTGIINGYAQVSNYGLNEQTTLIKNLLQEAIDYYPSGVAIAAKSSTVNNTITVKVDMAAKVLADYMVTVYFLENGIEVKQSDYSDILEDPDHYVHHGILRGTATSGHLDGGDPVELPLGKVVTKVFESPIPDSVESIDNMEVVVYVTYPGGHNKEVPAVARAYYGDYGYMIDNAVILPANGSVEFRYEE